jgi:DNA sulfur modification protein DndC
MFYEPTAEHIERLSGRWCCSYSGGKDSTSLVTWIEWLRCTGQIDAPRPQLVQSDTMVEDTGLQSLSRDMMALLRTRGWECAVVEPKVNERLYCQILGRGVTPVHAGGRKMRWCTRATKIDPMKRWRKVHSSGLTLTGLRIGESAIRDGKILKSLGCSSGGECGIPNPDDNTYSPLLDWTTCKVIDWLDGNVDSVVRRAMADILPITRKLVEIYSVVVTRGGFDWAEPEVSAARFGCIGCPAIAANNYAPRSVIARYGKESPLCELYDVWFEARRRDNRLVRFKEGKDGRGPIKMAVRKLLFARIMDIQQRAGIVLVTPEDEAFIRQCWANKVYPRGWSEADEDTLPPENTPLFDTRS